MAPFSSRPRRKTDQEPDSVVLDTQPLVSDLLDRLPGLRYDAEGLLDHVMDCLTYDEHAQDRLSLMCADMVEDLLRLPVPEDHGAFPGRIDHVSEHRQRIEQAIAASNALHAFGTRIHALMRQLGLYRSGYLHYQFDGLAGHAMILRRLMVPVLQTPAPIEYLTDDDLWVRSELRRRRRR